MLDIDFIRNNPKLVQENAVNKAVEVDVDALLKLDSKVRQIKTSIDELRQERNKLSGKNKNTRPSEADLAKGRELKDQLAKLEAKLAELEPEYISLWKKVPNMAEPDVPVGLSEEESIVTKTVGEPTKFDFKPKNHAEIAQAKGWLDKERATKVTGSRFAYVKGDMARLSWAMMQWAADQLTDESVITKVAKDAELDVSTKPFTLVFPPYMIKTDVYDAMDRLEPHEDRYKIDGQELWLQGSAEHVLGSIHMDEIIPEADLPLRYLGYATSFRREAGTYGKDMEGIIRMHQFDKLEMESLTTKEVSRDEHSLMIALQEHLMSQLELPYRVLNKCTFDIGKPNARGVDIEVWLPGQDKYRETHTADYMTDYQTRRLSTRVRRTEGGEVELLHTNDATALSQRPLIAIIENFQTKDGNVIVPKVLRPYMQNRDKI
ncbi:MAG: serine--tRNA ligase [Candidatus Nanosyncoccaceae bacterium]|jgi:seryl-tRNA synthetase